MRTMVVTGAFATHTTRLWNYYICPRTWDTGRVEVIAVNYLSRLQYIGSVIGEPIAWTYDQVLDAFGPPAGIRGLNPAVRNDLNQFRSLLNNGDHLLFHLEPRSVVNYASNPIYGGKGAFTRSHRYFASIDEMLIAHASGSQESDSDIEHGSSRVDGEVIDP